MPVRRHAILGTLVLALFAGSTTPVLAFADEPPAVRVDPNRLSMTTERAVVFKDGHAMVIKHATGVADALGRVHTDQVPDAAVLGCFWAISDAGHAVSLRAEWVTEVQEATSEQPCVGVIELLKVNLGKEVVIASSHQKPTPSVTGVVEQVLEGGSNSQAFAVLAVKEGQATSKLILPISDIQTVTGPDLKTTIARTTRTETKSKGLTCDLGTGAAGKGVSLRLFYFTPGIRWIPTYRVSGLGASQAELALQGEVINELEDLRDCELDLVVGVPNFRFKDVVSPLSLEQAMRETLVHSGSRGREMLRQQFSNAVFDQRDSGGGEPGGGGFVAPAEVAGSGEQDLFVYSVGKFSLAKGARATMPLWAQNAPLRHVYTYYVKPSQSRPQQSYSGNPNGETLAMVRPEDDVRVWHQLELVNESSGERASRPWTSGPALAMQDFTPISQDLLPYTAPGGKSLLPLTVAVDVQATYDEEELERKPASIRIDGYDYFQVKKRGTLTIKNFRKESSQCCLNVRVIGTAVEPTGVPVGEKRPTSRTPKIRLDALRPGESDPNTNARVNNVSQLTWDLGVAAGATETIAFEYTVYMR